ncbi:MAG: hypothetical protein ABIJ09_22115 [Pseudomonadota bacterium]
MSNSYRCPHCKASLNPGNKVVLRIGHGRKRGLVLLSPQVGNYKTIVGDDLVLSEGDRVQLACPVCGEDLTSPVSRNLCHVLRLDEEGEPQRVYFSKNFGEQATFVVHHDEVRMYGADVELYDSVNFFGEGGRGG